jgi:hypothetical protein
VLFCDLVGSTEITSHLDPEQWREIVGEYHRAAAQAIERFGGRVAQYLGDGVMAYFGYPEAYDNDADENRKISRFSGSTRMPNPLLWGMLRDLTTVPSLLFWFGQAGVLLLLLASLCTAVKFFWPSIEKAFF